MERTKRIRTVLFHSGTVDEITNWYDKMFGEVRYVKPVAIGYPDAGFIEEIINEGHSVLENGELSVMVTCMMYVENK